MSDFLVNTTATGAQSGPTVTVLSNGNYVVVWTSEDGLDSGVTPATGIRAQLYAPDGTPIGTEILVNSNGEEAQAEPVVQALADGGFAILWSSADMADWETSGSVIRGRIFDGSGSAAAPDFVVYTDGDSTDPAITALDNGTYLVTWTSMDFVEWQYDVRGQVIDATGAPVGSSFLVSESAEGEQTGSASATLAGGTPVVAFIQETADGDDAVYLRLLDATAATPGAEILVAGSASSATSDPAIAALDDGGFIVVWAGEDGIVGQRFDASAAAVGTTFVVSSQVGQQSAPQILALPDGGFFVVWQASDETYGAPLETFIADGSGSAIRGRFFDENGVAVAQDVIINTTTAGNQTQPTLTLLDDGTILLTYASGDTEQGAANGTAIRAIVIEQPESWEANAPVSGFTATPVEASFAENTAIGTTIATLSATDPESGAITYEILNWAGGKFEIVGNEVKLRAAFDFEAAEEYEVLVRATDSAGNVTDTAFSVSVTDVAETEPFAIEANAALPTVTAEAMSITLADGRFVVAHRNLSDVATKAQVYNADGTSSGVAFLLESDTTGTQLSPSLAARPDGGFVAVWTVSNVVYMRIFDEDLAPQANQLQISTTTGTNRSPSVAVFEDGSFVVVWSASGTSGDGDGGTVRARLFSAAGTPVGDDFVAVSTTEGNATLTNQAVTALEGGRFVVTWTSYDSESADADGGTIIRARVFEADGEPVDDDFVVNASTDGFQNTASILALDDGGFLVLWQSSDGGDDGHVGGFEGSTFLVRGQIFDADGNTVGDELVLNDVVDGQQYQVRATQLSDGKIAVVYFSAESAESATYVDTIRLAVFDESGSQVGESSVVAKASTLGSAVIANPQVTALADGRVAVSWDETVGGVTSVHTAVVDTDPPLGFTGSEGLVWEFSSATVSADATAGTVIATITVTYPDTWYEDGAPGSFSAGLDTLFLADGSEIDASQLFKLEEVDIDLDTNTATYQLVLSSDVAGSELIQDFHLGFIATGYSVDGNDTYVDRGTIQMDLGGDGFVVPDNHAPTDLALSGYTVAANARAGTVVGTLSATDADGDALTYVLESDHDGLFELVTEGDVTSLVLTQDIDTNVGNGYFLNAKVLDEDGAWDRDLFSIQVTEAEEPAPINLALSASAIAENSVFGTVVGTLSATAWDGGALSYTLTDDADGMFQIVGNELRVKTKADYETAASHTITVTVTEENGGETTKDFTIAVSDVDEAPVVTLSNTTILESARTGMAVGTLSGIDPEGEGDVTFSLVSGAGDNGSFDLRTNGDGSVSVVLKNPLDHETSSGDYDLVVKASDANGNETTKTIVITVGDDPFKLSATPTGKTYASIAESATVGTQIGYILQFDASFVPVSATLVDDAGGLFSITTAVVGTETRYYLTVNGQLDYETASVHAVTIRATNAGGTSYDKTFDIYVVDAAEAGDTAAGAITIDANTLLAAENGGVNWDTYVGDVYAVVTGGLPAGVTFAPDVADEYVYTLSDGSLVSYTGSDLAYWWSDANGEDVHVVAGTINTIVFGDNDEAVVAGSITNPEVSITGLDLTSGAEQMARIFGEANIAAVTWMYGPDAQHPADIEFFKLLLASYSQTFIGSVGDDTYTGTAFDDTITGGKGADDLDGGDGEDTAVFSGTKADYTFTDNGDGTITVTDIRADGDGVDTVANVEQFKFADQTVAASELPLLALQPVISIEADGVLFAKPSVGIPAGGTDAMATAADIDGDGDLDLVVLQTSNNILSWYENDGAGNIGSEGHDIVTADLALKVTATDIDSDGITDLVVTQNGRESVSGADAGKVVWYKGNGDGTFAAAETIASGLQNPYESEAIDFDGDGDIDLLTVSTWDVNKVTLSENDGSGNFTIRELEVGAAAALSIAVADVNGDGRLDIITGGSATLVDGLSSGSTISIGLNNGDGTFTEQTVDVGLYPSVWDVEVADMDGDGDLDIIGVNPNTSSIYLLSNDGSGTFGAAVEVVGGNATRIDTAVGDVDGDGDVDIVSTQTAADGNLKVSFYENDGTGAFTEHVIDTLYQAEEGNLVLADLDGNGLLDIIRGGRAGATVETRNDADVALTRYTFEVDENTPEALSGIAFTGGAGSVAVTLAVSAGTIAAETADGVTVSGSGSDTVVLAGSIADINAFLAAGNAVYAPLADSGDDAELTVTLDDGTATAAQVIVLDVQPYVGDPPAELDLTGATVAENAAVGTVIGTLSATDPEGGALTYSIVSDPSGSLVIVDDELQVGSTGLNYEAATSHAVEIAVTDADGNTVKETFTIAVTDADEAPTNIRLSNSVVYEDAAVGAVVATLTAVDPESGGAITFALADDANGAFEIVGNELRVKSPLDYETTAVHAITVTATDVNGNASERTVNIYVGDADEAAPEPLGTITIDASGSDGMDLEAFITGGFLADAANAGFPVFDNGSSFSGEEMFIGYGSTSDSKYVLAHGDIEYSFGTHTVHGTINTIEFGTVGSGSYDSNGYFVGGNALLTITGLELSNALTPEVEVEATGAVHNFAAAYMYGSAADPDRLALFAEHLDEYAQNFIGSEGNDVYTGTIFDDTIAAGSGEDVLAGGGGEDTVDGGEGVDTFVFTGNLADYDVATVAGVTTVTDRRTSPADGVAVLRNIEFLQFVDQQVALVTDLPPVALVLSSASIAEDAAAGTVVGVLSATDPEGGAVSFSLTDDAGGRFEVIGNELRVKAALDYETATTHEILVRVSDANGNTSTKSFVVDVTDVLEATIAGDGGKNSLKGGKGSDVLDGGAGRDKLDGGKGDDILVGGAGKDVLKGGKGADVFVFQFASDSTVKGKGRDTILDFKRKDGDKIDLSAIDPLNDSGAFDYIGKAKFSGEAGELRWQKKSGSTLVTADIDGDGKADFAIALAKAMSLKEADFIL